MKEFVTPKPLRRTKWISATILVIPFCLIPLFLRNRPFASTPKDALHQQLTQPINNGAVLEMDITQLGLKLRSEVISIVGRPDSENSDGSGNYSWGITYYKDGRLEQLDYTFKTKAETVSEALEKVGLHQTSQPRKGPLSSYWNASTGPLLCCGFEMDNVVVPADLSGISIGFKRSTRASKEEPSTGAGPAPSASSKPHSVPSMAKPPKDCVVWTAEGKCMDDLMWLPPVSYKTRLSRLTQRSLCIHGAATCGFAAIYSIAPRHLFPLLLNFELCQSCVESVTKESIFTLLLLSTANSIAWAVRQSLALLWRAR